MTSEAWVANPSPAMPQDVPYSSRAASTFKIQKLGNEAGLPTLADIAAVKQEFRADA